MDAKWLQEQFERPGYTQTALAQKLGVGSTTINKMVKGRRRIRASEVEPIRAFFGMPPESNGHAPVSVTNKFPNPIVASELQILVFRSTVAIDGKLGGIMVDRESQRGVIERAGELLYAKRAFAFEVPADHGDAYRTRDILVVDPDSISMIGDDCLFVRDPENPIVEGLLRRFVNFTDREWIVRVYGADREQRLARVDFPNAWRVRQRIMRA